MNVSLQTAGISNATVSPASGQRASSLKLRKAASDFESILLSSLWKSMKTTVAGEDDSGAGESLKDLGIQAVSSALSRAGGLGIAKLILHALDKSETSAPPSQQEAESLPNNAARFGIQTLVPNGNRRAGDPGEA